ncbi:MULTISPECIES: dephospho-CoA kinase [Bacillus]|uniref:Dephospho-CoA kinase n=5 Tax=Bacillus cereus group TaxID=86661 RepID=COAE_BACAN|nr:MULTISPECIES: dephospho-CoA kinase [Bacillus]Q6HSG2.1 RecName: Full=Dephospho-CoA kinase; AltName: Full=Dephosphocoenzyme A kinase [Bacillus anthracis]EDX58566.1 dephospho-CoA kinase [Bacillus cereus W]EJT19947.1 dephospho-CoA kinase [Bacillus anthracis str. UR-1]EXJ18255.1 dephospho-CoA kinase [Bacillus anthracis str. 95014]COE64260.1 dephospho-CoA kinase [Streptococcus pneumoniae]CUB53647.1 Dephospho-CoA kinase [Bacillus subtilis]
MTVVIGLTGGIASGKSTVSQMFRELSIPVIDADIIAREVVEKGKPAYNKIVEVFGTEVLQEDGELDRPKLGSVVFYNEEKRLQLNKIVHPAVREEMNRQKEMYIKEGMQAVVLDIPLLFESKLTSLVDRVLVVAVKPHTQLERLMKRNNFSEEEATARIQSQMPLEEKVKNADEVINNDGTIMGTKTQLQAILKKWNIID